jgi:hypothetical protein
MTVDCDTMHTFLSILWALLAAVIVGPICWILGKRSHPVEKAARRNSDREFSYRGPGGGS